MTHSQSTHQLGGQIGTDLNFSPATHTGHSKKQARHTDPQSALTLTSEEQDIYDGKKGDILQKAIKTVVAYGELFGAQKLVKLGGAPHMAVSWGSNGVEPLLKIYRQLYEAGLKTYAPFTADPKPMDPENLPVTDEEQAAVDKIYNRMEELEDLNMKLGMRSDKDWSCACYLPEMGNTPKLGDYLAWSESSAINYSNSVLGARTNRNSMGIDMLCNILGKAPLFGLMTDEGRQATWLIDVKTTKMPHPEMIGSAIGLKVMEDVSYVTGMDRFISEVNEETAGYLKDFGAATASNGAVGLYHMEGVTPEAIDKGRDLLNEGYQTYVIDDAELDRIYNSYPDLWKGDGTPQRVFLGCPHMSYGQMTEWGNRIVDAMEKAGQSKISVPTYMFGSSYVKEAFEKRNPEVAKKLEGYGVSIPICCPMMWCSTPVEGAERVATNSNKTRVYTTARFFFDDVLTELIVTGKLPAGVA